MNYVQDYNVKNNNYKYDENLNVGLNLWVKGDKGSLSAVCSNVFLLYCCMVNKIYLCAKVGLK